MVKNKVTFLMFKNLWSYLPKKRQRQFFLILVLMLISSISEVISMGAILPFLGVITSPEQIYNHHLLQPIIQMLEIKGPEQLLLPVTLIFIGAALFAGVVRIVLLYVMTKFSYAAGADISIDIYRRTLYQKYSDHIERNSSEVINSIIVKTNTVIGNILNPALIMISSTVLLIGILYVLFIVNFKMTIIAISVFLTLYLGISFYTRKKLSRNSQCISDQSTKMIRSLQEGLGGIRDVIINGSQPFYCKLYRDADLALRSATGDNRFISQSPRYLMETLGMILIALLAYSMTQDNSKEVIPILGALALGAQKLLPVLQQFYSSYSSINGASSSFKDVLNLLNQPLPGYAYTNKLPEPLLHFKKEIKLSDISFRYAIDSPWVVKDVNLTIKKGECVGFVGTTGDGKSTLVDIIMGLLFPEKGVVKVDGKIINHQNIRSWHTCIAHVPQNIFLSDGTIEENIAFGKMKEEIDQSLLKKVAKQAKVSDFVEKLHNGYQTIIGEQGVKLSGGQRQRIGIARALYNKSKVLVLDEATSALDSKTECEVMESIEEIDAEVTILIIAHRITTLKACDKVVRLNKGKVVSVESYQELINNKGKPRV